MLILGFQQISNSQQNVVGLHLQPLVFGELRFSYERAFTDKISSIVNFGYKIPGKIPKYILDESQPTDYGLPIETTNEIGGYQFVPELGIYFKDNNEPQGLYISPYLRFSKYYLDYNTEVSYTFSTSDYNALPQEVRDYLEDNNLGKTLSVNTITTSDFNQTGFGIQLGYQWIVSEKLAIDLYFLGIELDKVNLNSKAYSPDAQELGIDYTQWKDEIEGSLNFTNDIPLINADFNVEVQSDKVIGTANTLAPWFRGGIKIGFAF